MPNPRDTLRNSRPHVRLNSNPNDLLDNPDVRQPSSWRPPPSPILASNPRRNNDRAEPTNTLYSMPGQGNSNELLLPPRPQSRSRRYRDASSSPAASPIGSPHGSPPSTVSSRRSSIDSTSSLIMGNRYGPYEEAFPSPTVSSRPGSRSGSEEADVNTQTVSEKYNIMPSAGLLLYPEDIEKDDYLHNPQPGEKEPRECNIFSKRGLVNVGGLAFIIIGILLLFIAYPILTYSKIINPDVLSCSQNPNCLRDNLPLLKNVRTGLIDPDTPESVKTRIARDGSVQNLVFSDEFNTPGRSFYEQDDAFFQGANLWYGATQDVEWYDPDAITTSDGTLTIQFDALPNHGLKYRSGMLQSWNQLCFKGGYIEASVSLPGRGDTVGFWPGFWTMGNLGRPGYLATTEGMWPYSYHDACDYGITPNQSSTDGLSWLPGMRLPACSCPSQDHPSPGISRSAPEIDAIEASTMFLLPASQDGVGSASQSFQLAPFDVWYQPNYDFVELYNPQVTQMNAYRGGPYQQAFSGLSSLNNDWYDGNAYQSYGFEYQPGGEGYLSFFIGEEGTYTLEGASIGPNGNIGQRVLPQEPMSIVANFGMSPTFSQINLTGIESLLPATMRFDYIRIYQGDGDLVTCDPPGYPTTEYIAAHPEAYMNAQATSCFTGQTPDTNGQQIASCMAADHGVLAVGLQASHRQRWYR